MLKRYLTTDANRGVRLEEFLQLKTPELSRTRTLRAIEFGRVHVDGHRFRNKGYIQ